MLGWRVVNLINTCGGDRGYLLALPCFCVHCSGNGCLCLQPFIIMHEEVTFILDSRLVLVWQRQIQQTHGLQEKAVIEGGRLVFLNFIQGCKICRVWWMSRRLVTGEMDWDCCSVILLEITAVSINWAWGLEKVGLWRRKIYTCHFNSTDNHFVSAYVEFDYNNLKKMNS